MYWDSIIIGGMYWDSIIRGGGFGTALAGYLLRGQVLHAAGHLVGAGDQVLDGHVLHGHLVRVVAVLHAGGPPGPQVLPQVPLGRKLHDHVQRACGQGGPLGRGSRSIHW